MGVRIFFVAMLLGVCGWFLREIFIAEPKGNSTASEINFSVLPGESVSSLAARLEEEQVVRSKALFKRYAQARNIDKNIQSGTYTIVRPFTLSRVIHALSHPESREERTITIIPGWDLRDIADYFESEDIASSTEVYRLVGEPARLMAPTINDLPHVFSGKPENVSLEGYLSPNTYRIYTDATTEDIMQKFVLARANEWSAEMFGRLAESGRTMHEVLTIASIVEREVRSDADRAKVADIFWRRFDAGWGLQADSTVHYAVGKKGDVFTTKEDRARENLWNTYKFAGLPPGPISNPGLPSIMATLYPEKNSFWYFLTTVDGEVKYAKTIEEHGRNVAKYLR